MKKLLFLCLLLLLSSAAWADLVSSYELIFLSDQTETSGFGTTRDNVRYRIFQPFSDGTGTFSADLKYRGSGDIAANASITIDLVGGINDLLGNSVSFATVKSLVIENTATTTLVFGNPPVDSGWSAWCGAVTETLFIPASGVMVLAAPRTGYAIAAGSDTIRLLSNGDGTGSYRIWAIGTSK